MPVFVNQVEITDDEVHAEMQYHTAESVEEARYKAAQALVIRQLFLQEAQRKNLTGEEGEMIDALLEQEVAVPEADEESCRRYYQQNRERFMDKKAGEVLPLESVIDHIRRYLHARSLKTGISQYIQILAGKAKIAGFALEGSDNPLVQ